MSFTDRVDSVSRLGLWHSLAAIGRRELLAALLLIVVLLVTTVPARVVSRWLPTQVVLEGFSGTVWNGAVARARLRLPQGDFMLGRVEWVLDPLSLLRLEPALLLDAHWGVQQFNGEVTLRGLDTVVLDSVSARIDTSVARKFIPLYIGGSLVADISALKIDRGQLSAIQGRLSWQNAAWTARSGDVALGTYVLDISGEAGNIQGEIVTLSGPLTMTGELALLDQRYRVALSLTGPATTQQALRDALALIAVPNAQGFDVIFEGMVPIPVR